MSRDQGQQAPLKRAGLPGRGRAPRLVLCRHHLSRLLFFPLLLASLLALAPRPASAQALPVYWRYDAFGRLDQVTVADINYDGVDEILVVAEENNVALVLSDGRQAWTYQAIDPVLQVATVNFDGSDQPQKEILLATASELIVLNSSGRLMWKRMLDDVPVGLAAFDRSGTGQEEILVAFQSNRLQLIDREGQPAWTFEGKGEATAGVAPLLTVADFDRDGHDEVVFAYLVPPGFSRLALVGGDGFARWEDSVSGSLTALTAVAFKGQGPLQVAVATTLRTNRTFVYLYDAASGAEHWFRTPNKPVTSLAAANLPDGPALLVGTSVGAIIAYDERGRRLWSRTYWDQPNRKITAISASRDPARSQRFSLAVTLAPEPGGSAAELLLLNRDGRVLVRYPSASVMGLTAITDINHDDRSELLLARFAALELLDPGIGARQNLAGWNYSLNAQPRVALVADVNRDGQDELLVGGSDGRLHILADAGTDANAQVFNLGGVITHIALAENAAEALPELVVVRNTIISGENVAERFEAGLVVMRPDGRIVWEENLPVLITSLLVADINNSGPPEIVIGTSDGQIHTYSLAGEEFWQSGIGGSVEQLAVLDRDRVEIVAASSTGELHKFNNKGTISLQIAAYLQDIAGLLRIPQEGELKAQLLVLVEDGTVRGLNWRGIQLPEWQRETNGLPTLAAPAGNSFLIASDEAELIRVDYDNNLLWRLRGLGRINSLYWGDLDGDVRPDVAVGNREGSVYLYPGDGGERWDQLSLGSGVAFVSALRHPDGPGSLVVITENGVVQQFRAETNRPPLLQRPQTEAAQGQYTVFVSVKDVENDPVTVNLQLYDAGSRAWLAQGERTVEGAGQLFWSIDPALAANGLTYRFLYSAGPHNGQVGPLPGVRAVPPELEDNNPAVALSALVVLVVGGVLALSINRSHAARARRFYQRLKNDPERTLPVLANEYRRRQGSPDFLLNLANQARQDGDRLLAGLADGLYLLADRPEAGLNIVNGILEEAVNQAVSWHSLAWWQVVFRHAQALLEAPSITELSLLRPQLVQLLQSDEESDLFIPAMEGLLPILTALRDCERVDMADDRLIYLHEASVLTSQLAERVSVRPVQLAWGIVEAICQRWSGLIGAGIEELRGQAKLEVTLKTRQLAPQPGGISMAVEVGNKGRAPAENITVRVLEDAAYRVLPSSARIHFLPPGHSRQVTVAIEPGEVDRFRVAFQVTYDDRHQVGKKLAFGDMVHLLAPARYFEAVANPYVPGTPLRRHSVVFYGRQDLFQFIARNAGKLPQRNVLILVGQRRTGKTSALLRLEQHLPPEVLPAYIDCQSFGVTPGMPALFHDIAWFIADALARHGLTVTVPPLRAWQADATGQFQRRFLPAVRRLLPPGTTLLLVFDEFEALEHLVNDGVLPATLFPYLRHLMQHSEGLGFVFAGTHQLQEMSTDYWSVLFNIALYRKIGFLDREAAIQLITEPVAPNLIYDDLAVEKILRVTAGHPYFLQLVCYTLVNRANDEGTGYVTINDVNATLHEMLRLGEVHFAYLWQRSSYTERALLTAVAHLMDTELPFRPADLQQYLGEYGIHLTPSEVTTALNRLVEREIMREISGEATTLYELRIGLVGLWTAENKSLSKLYEEKAPWAVTA